MHTFAYMKGDQRSGRYAGLGTVGQRRDRGDPTQPRDLQQIHDERTDLREHDRRGDARMLDQFGLHPGRDRAQDPRRLGLIRLLPRLGEDHPPQHVQRVREFLDLVDQARIEDLVVAHQRERPA